MKNLNDIIIETAKELNISEKAAKRAYNHIWLFIKHKLSEISLDDIDDARASFNIPSMGKFYINKKKVHIIKKLNDEDKRNKTVI